LSKHELDVLCGGDDGTKDGIMEREIEDGRNSALRWLCPPDLGFTLKCQEEGLAGRASENGSQYQRHSPLVRLAYCSSVILATLSAIGIACTLAMQVGAAVL